MSLSFYLESLGCAKNQVDSEYAIAALEAYGLSWTGDPDAADCVIVNTCGFITSAKQESINVVLSFRRRYPDKKIILVGCLALRYREALEHELEEVDGVWGDVRDPGFGSFVSALVSPDRKKKGARNRASLKRKKLLSRPGSVYVKIADGCSNRCSYCAIPLIRGDLKSRTIEEIVGEIRRFLKQGIREVNLIAQDTSSFGLDRGARELAALLVRVAELPGDFWIRLLYIHPDHFSQELRDVMSRLQPKVLPYFDLPFQHASEPILASMNRRGNAASYLCLVESIRTALPAAVIRTTFLTGFPGETDDDFNCLLSFQERLRPQWAGVFVYSPEEGTPAFNIKPRVPARRAHERKVIIEERQARLTAEWLDGLAGREVDVLVEERVEGENLFIGRAWFQAPEVDGLMVVQGKNVSPGECRRVRIEGRAGVDLKGRMID